MSNNRIYIFGLILLVLVISLLSSSHNNIEGFGCGILDVACHARWLREEAERLLNALIAEATSGVDRILSDVTRFGKEVKDLPVIIPRTAKTIAEGVIDVALKPPREAVSVVKRHINLLQTDTNNLFKTIKSLFGKLKYFTELLMLTVNRALVCSKGAERVVESYTLRTSAVLTKLTEIHGKIKICPDFINSVKTPITYYKNCISQIIPLIRSCYKYVQILIAFYKEILTYEELFPQDADAKNYCATHHKNVKNQADGIAYAKKCNHCLHLKSILKLGLGELNAFADGIKVLVDKGAELKGGISKLGINIPGF